MDFLDVLGLLFFGALGGLWFTSLNVRAVAMQAAKSVCHSEKLLLLDDTVAIQRIGVVRDGEGVLSFRRVYSFEYSVSGDDRQAGHIVLLGDRVLTIHLDQLEAPVRALFH